MPIEQLANPLRFTAFFGAAGLGKTGRTVTVDVYENDTQIVTAASATEIGGGLYRYALSSGSVDAEGVYVAIFKTTDTTVDAQHIPVAWTVNVAGVEHLDANVSSRAIGGATVTVASPVTQGGSFRVVQNKDYSTLINTALEWTLTNPPLTTPDSVTFVCAELAFSKACSYTEPTITLQLTAAETAAFPLGTYAFVIGAVISGLAHPGLVRGCMMVQSDPADDPINCVTTGEVTDVSGEIIERVR